MTTQGLLTRRAAGAAAGLVLLSLGAGCDRPPSCKPPDCVRFEGHGALAVTGSVTGSGEAELNVLDTTWAVGVLDGRPAEEFGRITDAAFDPDGNVYLLDAVALAVRVFDGQGEFLRTFGGSGSGPGEFASPQALLHDGRDTLYVLDRRNGVSLFHTTPGGVTFGRTISLRGLPGSDFCLLDDGIYVFAHQGGNVVHEFDRDGQSIRSFGELFGPPEYYVIQQGVNRSGKIACVPRHGIIVVNASIDAEVRAYRTADASLVWSDSLPDFVPPMMQATPHPDAPTGFAYSSMCSNLGCGRTAMMRPLDADIILAQSRRVPRDEGEVISSCLLVLATGKCAMTSEGLPLLPAVFGSQAVAIREELFPVVSLLEMGYAKADSEISSP